MARGEKARALKPVITGWDDDPAAIADSDTGQLLVAQGLAPTAENIDACSPFRFKAPLAPDMAAAREGLALDYERLIAFCRDSIAAKAPDETLYIEGVGGVMVPLTENKTVLDWMSDLSLPVLLVAGTYLGTISHTLTAALALRERHIAVRAIILSESVDSPPEETAAAIQRHLPGAAVRIVGRGGSAEDFQWT